MEIPVKFFKITTIALLFVAAGCATSKKSPELTPGADGRPTPEYPTPIGPPEVFGPPPPEAAPVYGPEPVKVRPVVLVLGPGMARGFAHVGVIQALHEAKIPVGAIFGTEMGGLIGALYAMEGSINRFEWALLRFKDDVFVERKSFLPDVFEKAKDKSKLDAELERVFRKKDLNQAKVPIQIAIQLKGSHSATVVEKGDAAQALRAAIAAPGIISEGQWEGSPAIAANLSRPFLITEARALGIGPVIVIDVSEGHDQGDLRDADLVIHPDMAGVGGLDFQKRTEIAFKGKSAMKDKIQEIRRLVGLEQ